MKIELVYLGLVHYLKKKDVALYVLYIFTIILNQIKTSKTRTSLQNKTSSFTSPLLEKQKVHRKIVFFAPN